jgi:hypothetical protein
MSTSELDYNLQNYIEEVKKEISEIVGKLHL